MPRPRKKKPNSSITKQLQIALKYQQNNRLTEAENICHKILKKAPKSPDALHLLGVLAIKKAQFSQATSLIKRAISHRPGRADYYHNLAISLENSKIIDEAISCYRRALSIEPRMLASQYNLAVLLHKSGQHSEAINCYSEILKHNSTDVNSLINLGSLYLQQERLTEAFELYEKLASIQPKNQISLHKMGSILLKMGRAKSAIPFLEQTVELRPDSAEALNDLGNAYRETKKYSSALSCIEKAEKHIPHHAEILNSKGLIYLDQRNLQKAKHYFTKALSYNPNHTASLNNLGLAYMDLGDMKEAVKHFQGALKIDATFIQAANNLGICLRNSGHLKQAFDLYNKAIVIAPQNAELHINYSNVLSNQGQLQKAIAACRKALNLNPKLSTYRSNLLFMLNNDPTITNEEMWLEAQTWDLRHGNQQNTLPSIPSDYQKRVLKIGYVSPDFRTHSVSFFFLSLLTSHSPQKVETFCYAEVMTPDEITEEIKEKAGTYRSTVGLTDDEIVTLIKKDEIDILVDLAGHTANNRLPVFAARPAPIQISWLGYPNTTGMQAIDYRLTDDIADPPGSGKYYSEKLIRLPGGFLCYRPPVATPKAISIPPSLDKQYLTFGSFNNITKLTPQTINVWCEILRLVKGSRLILKSLQLNDEVTKNRLYEMFNNNGIPSDRIDMLGKTPTIGEHLKLYNQVDVCLDPFLYNGTTTTLEALWMGVPVITLSGDRHAARVGNSILSHIGLSELIAENTEEYIAICQNLASDFDRLRFFRKNIRNLLSKSSLCDDIGFAQKIENFYFEAMRQTIL